MRPRVDMTKCFASKSVCKPLKMCPEKAVSYIETDEPIMDKNLVCNCTPPTAESSCGCDCGDDCGTDLYSCGGSPYGRIIIDQEKCTGCGICADVCCGTAINMVE